MLRRFHFHDSSCRQLHNSLPDKRGRVSNFEEDGRHLFEQRGIHLGGADGPLEFRTHLNARQDLDLVLVIVEGIVEPRTAVQLSLYNEPLLLPCQLFNLGDA